MPTTTINGIIYSSASDTEAIVGTDSNTDSNAVDGEFNPFLSFPESVEIEEKTYLVTAVGRNAYRFNEQVKTIHIHKYIKTLKYRCFDWCTSCYKITFDKKSKLENLEESSLNGLIVTSMEIPKTVTKFEKYCFGVLNNLAFLTYFGITNPSSDIDIFYKTPGPYRIFVGYNYPYTLFNGKDVVKIPNFNERVYSNHRCKQHFLSHNLFR